VSGERVQAQPGQAGEQPPGQLVRAEQLQRERAGAVGGVPVLEKPLLKGGEVDRRRRWELRWEGGEQLAPDPDGRVRRLQVLLPDAGDLHHDARDGGAGGELDQPLRHRDVVLPGGRAAPRHLQHVTLPWRGPSRLAVDGQDLQRIERRGVHRRSG
jgi:hypothetical protein